MFNVGDRIVYPMHGAGVIEESSNGTYPEPLKTTILSGLPGEMKVMIPVCNKDLVGLREIISKDEVGKVLEVLRNKELDMSSNWNRRYRENMEKIKSGNIYDVAEVVSSLSLRDREKGLSTGERKMLENAKSILYSELALVEDLDEEQVQSMVEDCLN